MQGLNISFLYDRYSTAADFVVYAFVLVYASRIALARTFGEPHSRPLGTVVGLMLAVSLSIIAKSLRFNLRSFGPIAAIIVLLMLGLVIYNLMHQAGAGHLACGSVSFIVTVFSIRAIAPGMFAWANKTDWAGYLDTFLLLAILVAIIKVLRTVFSWEDVSSLKNAVNRMAGSSNQFADTSTRQTTLEASVVRKDMKRLTRHGRREARHIVGSLRQIINTLRQHGANRDVAQQACQVLQGFRQREHEVSAEIARIQAIDEKLLRLDFTHYRDLEQAYSRLTDQQKPQCKRLFAQERDKIGIEKAIRELAIRSESYAVRFDRCTDTACRALKAGNTAEALQWLEKAQAEEQFADRLLGEIRKKEKILVRVMRQQLASFARLKQ